MSGTINDINLLYNWRTVVSHEVFDGVSFSDNKYDMSCVCSNYPEYWFNYFPHKYLRIEKQAHINHREDNKSSPALLAAVKSANNRTGSRMFPVNLVCVVNPWPSIIELFPVIARGRGLTICFQYIWPLFGKCVPSELVSQFDIVYIYVFIYSWYYWYMSPSTYRSSCYCTFSIGIALRWFKYFKVHFPLRWS